MWPAQQAYGPGMSSAEALLQQHVSSLFEYYSSNVVMNDSSTKFDVSFTIGPQRVPATVTIELPAGFPTVQPEFRIVEPKNITHPWIQSSSGLLNIISSKSSGKITGHPALAPGCWRPTPDLTLGRITKDIETEFNRNLPKGLPAVSHSATLSQGYPGTGGSYSAGDSSYGHGGPAGVYAQQGGYPQQSSGSALPAYSSSAGQSQATQMPQFSQMQGSGGYPQQQSYTGMQPPAVQQPGYAYGTQGAGQGAVTPGQSASATGAPRPTTGNSTYPSTQGMSHSANFTGSYGSAMQQAATSAQSGRNSFERQSSGALQPQSQSADRPLKAAAGSPAPEFPEVDNLTIGQLREISENSAAFEAFFESTKHAKQARATHKDLVSGVVSQAYRNMQLAQEATELKERLYDLQGIVKIEESELRAFIARNRAVLHKYSAEGVAEAIERDIGERMRKSEEILEVFLKGSMDVQQFVTEYTALRLDTHLQQATLATFRRLAM